MNDRTARIRALAAWSQARSACLSPWLVAVRIAKFRAGAIQIVANQLVLLPLWFKAVPPAQDLSVTNQPPAYSNEGGGMCRVCRVAGFNGWRSQQLACQMERRELGPIRHRAMNRARRAHGRWIIVLRWPDVWAVEVVAPRLAGTSPARPGVVYPRGRQFLAARTGGPLHQTFPRHARDPLGHKSRQGVTYVRSIYRSTRVGSEGACWSMLVRSACRCWVVVDPGKRHHRASWGKPAR